MEEREMGSIKEEAINTEARTTTKNIADLPRFDIHMELESFEGVTEEGQKFSYKYVTDSEGIRYRIPWSVLTQIKEHLEEDDSLTFFKVKKSGEGIKTNYTVIPVKEKK